MANRLGRTETVAEDTRSPEQKALEAVEDVLARLLQRSRTATGLQEKHHIGAQIDVWGLVLSDIGRAMKEATK